MHITWHGLDCIRLIGKEASVLIDPFSKSSGLTLPRFQTDIVACSSGDTDPSNVSGEFFLVDIPGEYEKKGVFVYGKHWKNKDGKSTVVYRIQMEGISFAHIAAMDAEPTSAVMEMIEGVDVLFISIGRKDRLTAKQASDIVSIIEPRIVIPIGFDSKGVKESLEKPDAFVKELGIKPIEENKVKVTDKDLPADERVLYLMEVA